MHSHGRVNLLSRIVHEFLGFIPAINATILFCKMNIFLLLDGLPQKNYPLLHYQVKTGKVN